MTAQAVNDLIEFLKEGGFTCIRWDDAVATAERIVLKGQTNEQD